MARPRKIDSDLRHGRHCVFALHVHLVFVTKYRRNVFRKEHLDAMQLILASVCKDLMPSWWSSTENTTTFIC